MGKKIDAISGMVVVAHEPVKSMDCPAMSLASTVTDKTLLDSAGRVRRQHGRRVQNCEARQRLRHQFSGLVKALRWVG
jgi:Cu/Ag efflux protein CusF